MAITQQRVVRSPPCFVLGWGFRGRRIKRRRFRLGKSKMAAFGHFEKLQTTISLKHIIRFTLCMQTDHTLPSDSIVTVDAYDRRLDGYFVREGKGVKRKNEKADLEKIMREEYTFDWLRLGTVENHGKK